MRKIYIVLSMTGTWFAQFLRFATKAPFTHVSISLDKDLHELYSFGRKVLALPFIAGFVREDPSEGIFAKYPTRCLIYELEITESQYQNIKQLINSFITDQDKYKYNFFGLVLMKFNIASECKWHYVCSQFVAYVLSEGKVINFHKEYSLMRPMDFMKVRQAKKFYEGTLYDYVYCLKHSKNILSKSL